MTIYAHSRPDKMALGKVPVTISVTQPIAHWQALADKLAGDDWPECDLRIAILDAISQIDGALSKCGSGPMRDE